MYLVSPDDCLVLRALHNSSSLREAARRLQSDPAGLQRKVQRISAETGLLQKSGGKWRLTNQAIGLVSWVEDSIASQKEFLAHESKVRIASTLWMVEQFVIPNTEQLLKRIPSVAGLEVSGTEQSFENTLLSGAVDFVVVCHPPHDPSIAHKVIAPEKWVVIAPVAWAKKAKSAHDLSSLPFVRHKDLNPDLLLPDGSLLERGGRIVVDSLIGVRAAVASGLGWSFVPELSVKELIEIGEVSSVPHFFEMKRSICVWWLRHVKRSKDLAPQVCAWAKRVCGV